jgi:hypothetical protein
MLRVRKLETSIRLSRCYFLAGQCKEETMRTLVATILLSAVAALSTSAMAQTQSSGASGTLKDQDKAAITAQPPNQPYKDGSSEGTQSATSAQNSGAGIAGAAGGKNGPPAQQGTVGSNTQDKAAQQQDPAKVQGMPGNKSGPPAKR